MKFFAGLFLILLVLAAGAFYYYIKTGYTFGLGSTVITQPTVDVSSQDFAKGGDIPSRFTCDGEDMNPSFLLDKVPGNTKSLVFLLEDEDTKPVFTHWILFNIDPTTISIDKPSDLVGASIGTNDFGKMEYDGPCPPNGATHKYDFRLFALDTTLPLPDGAKRADIDKAMQGHIAGWGEIFGTYTR